MRGKAREGGREIEMNGGMVGGEAKIDGGLSDSNVNGSSLQYCFD